MYQAIIISILLLGLPFLALAHCPLCTAGAGAAALGLAWLGVGTFSIGLFVGAFGYALGFWIGRALKKKYIPHQISIFAVSSFALTVIPLVPILPDAWPLYLSFIGDYGTTYAVNRFLAGSIIGGLVVLISPFLSQKISQARNNKLISYQGFIITFFLLAAIALVFELIL